MKTKNLLCGSRNLFFALAVIFALAFVGCPADPEDGPTGGPGGGLPGLGGNISVDVTDENGTTKTTGYTTGDELSVSYDGTETVSYQWYKDGVAIDSETNATYTPIETGTYTVTISAAGYNPKTSDPITVTGPTLSRLSGAISITPDSDVVVGDELEAVYTGDETVTYQWYKDGVAILDETNETYTPDDVGIYTVRVSAANYAGKTSIPVAVGWPTPIAEDFTIGNLTQPVSNITAVTITPRTDRSTGEITIYYDGSTTLPSVVGEYTVTFDVAAAAGWNAASGLHAGTLTVIDAIQYTITGSGTSFTATRGSETVGTADQPIQDVITAIRTDANGDAVAIQFVGNGTDPLDIGTASAAFNNTDGTWGTVTLFGKITSANTTSTQGTVTVGGGVTVNSTADIADTSATNGRAIYNANTNTGGTVTISGGTVSATTGRAVYNASTGTVNITGGTVSGTGTGTGFTVYNASGTVHISGGAVSATESRAAHNDGTGTVNISGGTVSATTGYAVYNNGTGTVNITGGTVSVSVASGRAVYNYSTGLITVSGTAKLTSLAATTTSGTITIASSGTETEARLIISGGTVENTGTGTGCNAVYNASTGAVNITDGTLSATAGRAVYNNGTGVVNITGGKLSATTGSAVQNNNTGSVSITGGTVSATTGYAVYNSSTNTNVNTIAITLGGSPAITGRIRPGAAGKLNVNGTPAFAPAGKMYTLDYATYDDGMVAVTGGANYASSFTLYNQPSSYTLVTSGNNLAVHILSPIITTASLPDGTVGTAYNQTLAATGNTPITWSIDSGALPAGLSLDETTGVISGTPSVAETFNFTVKATNNAGNVTRQFSVTIAPAPSGTVWTTTSSGYIRIINDIAYGNNMFITVAENGGIMYSTNDGINWTAVGGTNPPFGTSHIRGIAYGNGRFIAVGDQGKLMWSTNGTGWTSPTAPHPFNTGGTTPIYSIAYGNNMWVVGGYGKMAYSINDGVNWTEITSSTFDSTPYIYSIAYGNGTWVAVANGGRMAYSTNGTTWTAVANSQFTTSDSINRVAYGNGTFIAVGSAGKMARSTNGSTWTLINATTSTFGSTSSVYGIAYGNGTWVAVGASGKMAYSTNNGQNWTAITNSPLTVTINAIVFGNNRWLAGGNDGKLAYAD